MVAITTKKTKTNTAKDCILYCD